MGWVSSVLIDTYKSIQHLKLKPCQLGRYAKEGVSQPLHGTESVQLTATIWGFWSVRMRESTGWWWVGGGGAECGSQAANVGRRGGRCAIDVYSVFTPQYPHPCTTPSQ